jgi:hypothetical protein
MMQVRAPEDAAARRSPHAFLAALGTDDIPHGSRVDSEGKSIGSFLDHLSGTEAQLREWGCDDAICLAGLYHSVYGTEGFQGFTLSVADRGVVRGVIGERAEAVAYFNCVMDRESLDRMTVEHQHRGAAPTEPPALPLRARPNPELGLDGSESFSLSAEQFSDLITVHLADHLEGFDHQMNKPGVQFINHAIDGEHGRWRIPELGWFGYRQQSYGAMAHILGGIMLQGWEAALRTVPAGAEPAHWVPAGEGAGEAAPARL